MTLRQALNRGTSDLHARLDRVLDSEDAIVVLMDRDGITSYCHGFGASGCQLELLWHQVDRTLRELLRAPAGDRARGAGEAEAASGI